MKSNFAENKKGFALVELLFVLILLTILVAAGIYVYRKQRSNPSKSDSSQVTSDSIEGFGLKLQEYSLESPTPKLRLNTGLASCGGLHVPLHTEKQAEGDTITLTVTGFDAIDNPDKAEGGCAQALSTAEYFFELERMPPGTSRTITVRFKDKADTVRLTAEEERFTFKLISDGKLLTIDGPNYRNVKSTSTEATIIHLPNTLGEMSPERCTVPEGTNIHDQLRSFATSHGYSIPSDDILSVLEEDPCHIYVISPRPLEAGKSQTIGSVVINDESNIEKGQPRDILLSPAY
jgi:prepilin-type N-terminal cleavage/methylation domain-containing protein